MEHKTFELIDVKADGDAGTFTALASVFGNVDRVGDRMLPGSFTKTLDTWRQSGKPIPIILSHNWDDPHKYVGEADPRAVYQSEQGLVVQGKMYTEESLAGKVYELMKRGIITGWSFGYKVPKGGQQKKDGVNEISEVELFEVGPTLVGANPDAQLQEIKSDLGIEEKAEDPKPADPEPEPIAAEKAVWSTAFINDLPDSSFLYIESGGSKDGDGKTTPRSLRHFPVKGPDGSIDMPHLRNALSRIPQANLPDSVKARATAAAQRMMGNNTAADAAYEKALDEMRNEVEGDMAELREAIEILQTEKTSEERRNEEPKRAKSPPDPLKEKGRAAVMAVYTDDLKVEDHAPEPEPEPEPPQTNDRELKNRAWSEVLAAVNGDTSGD